MKKNKLFLELEKKVKICKKCPLHKNRIKAVFGSGLISSKIMLIGQSPGKEEDLQGKPFVGRAGKLLNELLKKAHLDRKKIFLTNLVKCHPLKNRDPKKKEIEQCIHSYLYKQIDLIEPKIIITFGRLSSKYLFKKLNIDFDKISKMHGKPFNVIYNCSNIKIISMYHPAYALYNPPKRKLLEKDFRKLKT